MALASGSSQTPSTKPICCAASPLTGLPVGIRRKAAIIPTNRGSRWVPPAPGTTPSITSGKPMLASARASRYRQASASSAPPPRTAPCKAAIHGTGLVSICCRTSGRCGASGGVSNSPASAPAAKTPPAPLRITRESCCDSAHATASDNPCRIARLMALTGGLFNSTKPQLPCLRQDTVILKFHHSLSQKQS